MSRHFVFEALGPREAVELIFGDGQVEVSTGNERECLPVVFNVDGPAMGALIRRLTLERKRAQRG